MIPSILEVALRALLVALAVWAGLRLLRVRNVLAQKSAWGLVLAAAMLMPLLLPLALRWNVLPAATLALPAHWLLGAAAKQQSAAEPAPLPEVQTSAGSAEISASAARPLQRFAHPRTRRAAEPEASSMAALAAPFVPAGTGSAAPMSTIETAPPIERHAAAPRAASLVPAPATLAALMYLSVCGVLLLRLLYGLAAALTLWWDARPVTLGEAPAGLPLRSSRQVSSPVTIGSGVVLPDDFCEWDAEKLRIVLAHERSHVRQGDFYLQLLAGLYAAIFWFSPLGWWLKRTLSDLGEAISDRAGLEQAASRSSYAQLLLEFAALPRPTLIGVAMARTSSISHRIERLLNDATFRSAFAGSRRRALLAVLLVPVALFAATALIRVQSAEAAQVPAVAAAPAAEPVLAPEAAAPSAAVQAAPPAEPAAATSPSNPDQAPDAVAPQAPATPAAPADRAPVAAPAVPAVPAVPSADADLAEPPTPPEPPDPDDSDSITVGKGQSLTITNNRGRHYMTADSKGSGHSHGFGFSYSDDGDSWALITSSDQHMYFSGNNNRDNMASIERARKLAHGKFLWFVHDGKSYFIDDAPLVAGMEAMYKPMDELGRKQEELGRQQEMLGDEQERLGRLQEAASVPTPDMSKELAELNAAIAKLQSKKGGTMTEDDLGELEGKIGDLQGKIGELQGKIGEAQGKLGDQQGRLGDEQGRLGDQQGKLGEQQGHIAEEAGRKIKGIIDQSLRNGKARPVE